MTDRELLSAAIRASGLSVTRFAVEVMTREPRTIFRWLSGESPIPAIVRAKLERDVAGGEQADGVEHDRHHDHDPDHLRDRRVNRELRDRPEEDTADDQQDEEGNQHGP